MLRVINRLSLLGICLLLLFTYGCQNLDDENPIINESRSLTRSISEIPGLANAIALYVNPALSDRDNISSANQANTYFGMSIDLESIKSRIDSSNFTNYSMLLRDDVYNPRVIKNLVIGQDADGQWRTPILMTYTMSDEFYEQYNVTGLLEGFTGTIRKEQLQPLNYQTQQNNREPADNEDDPDDHGSDRDQPNTTCPDEVGVTSGGGTTSASGNSSGGHTEVCEVFLVTEYGLDDQGNRYVKNQYLTYENCYTVADLTSSDSENCENPTGEIPINEEFEEEPDCESFIFVSNYTEALWQQAVVRGVYFNIVLIDPATGVRGSTRIQFDQPIAFGVPTRFHTGETLSPGDAAWAAAGNVSEAMRKSARKYDGTVTSATDVRIYFNSISVKRAEELHLITAARKNHRSIALEQVL